MIKAMEPVAQALCLMESSRTHVGMGLEIWLELIDRLPTGCPMRTLAKDRAQAAFDNPLFLAANLLDPRLKGQSLTDEQFQKAREWVGASGGGGAHVALAAYIAEFGPFKGTFDVVWKLPADAWWASGRFNDDLRGLAVKALACHASSANIERIFATMGAVMGRRRTRLHANRVGKLAFLYRQLKTKATFDDSDSANGTDSD
jgi:hypothetical protein